MADNYLEKRMDDYRNGRLTKKKHVSGSGNGTRRSPLAGKRVLVTGGANGIGRAITATFRKEDCRVAIFDVDRKHGNEVAQQTGAKFYPCDLADSGQIAARMEQLFDDWGDLDIIINNAAECRFRDLCDTTSEEFTHTLRVNLVAPFEIARLYALHRRNNAGRLNEPAESGRIVNIASTRAVQSEPGTEAYSASKGGIIALTHSLMASLADLRITVNAILPGWIETGNYELLRAIDHQCHPSGRVGRPDDIARACVFLSGPDADFINGATLVIDGGMTRKMIYPE